MVKRKLKLFVVPLIYVLSLVMLIGSVFVIEKALNNSLLKDTGTVSDREEIVPSNEDSVVEEVVPVVNTDPEIIRPYVNPEVKVVNSYYNKDSDNATQENSLYYYGDTYMQNSGIDYATGSEFDVVSILDGTVIEVLDDEMMGKTIKIKHNNDLISVYQSMGSINFKVDDNITQGTVIGKSGENNISTDLGNHLHFELYYQGKVVNPDDYYGKLLSQLN